VKKNLNVEKLKNSAQMLACNLVKISEVKSIKNFVVTIAKFSIEHVHVACDEDKELELKIRLDKLANPRKYLRRQVRRKRDGSAGHSDSALHESTDKLPGLATDEMIFKQEVTPYLKEVDDG
jgi:hypothetical protein